MDHKWLVAHDFSEQAERALDRAARQLAALGGGTLVLTHVHAPLSTGFGIDFSSTTAFHDADRELDRAARARVEAIAKTVNSHPPPVRVDVRVLTGRPADQ